MSAAATHARTVVRGLLTSVPMSLPALVNITRGMTAKGRPKLSTTWLMTSVRVGSRPMTITTSDGTMVARRRIQEGIRRWRKPCMMTWPAMVPTEEEERPEARSDTPNTQLAAFPRSGSRVLCASSRVPTCVSPCAEERGGGHDEHGHVDEARRCPWRSTTSAISKRRSRRSFARLARHDPVLRERGMQEDGVRHDRGAEDARPPAGCFPGPQAAGPRCGRAPARGAACPGWSPPGSSPR